METKEFLKILATVFGLSLLLVFGVPLIGHLVFAWDRWLGKVLGN